MTPLSGRLAGLDGLRALAALAVFGVHFNQTVRLDGELGPFEISRLLANGELGVSLFFTLSGFLLGLPFWRRLDEGAGGFALKAYAARRLARILPAYWGCLSLLVLISGLWRFAPAYPDIALHFAFLFNYAEFSIFSINAPFWTLAVEVQFYIVLPLLFVILSWAGSCWRPWIVVAIGVIAYLVHYALVHNFAHIVAWPFDTRLIWIRPYGAVLSQSLLAHLPHFLLGLVAGWLYLRLNPRIGQGVRANSLRHDATFWCAGAVVLVLAGTRLEDAIQIPYGRYGLPLVPMLLAAMIVAAPLSRYARACLEVRPLRALGIVSYGIYIYHLPCLMLVDRLMGARDLDAAQHGLAFGTAALALTLVAATLSFLVIERPALNAARRLAGHSRVRSGPAGETSG